MSPIPFDIPRSLALIRQLMLEGRFKAVIDRQYPLQDIVKAYRYVEQGQKRGNAVITVEHDD